VVLVIGGDFRLGVLCHSVMLLHMACIECLSSSIYGIGVFPTMEGMRSEAASPYTDSVDGILDQWAVQRVDLDFSPVGIITRLARVRGHLDGALAEVFDGFDLSPADFVTIITLRRAGPPFTLPQARLMNAMNLTSGTVSVRLARLENLGVIRREDDTGDRRVQLVRLTPAGLDLFDRIAPVHLANEDRLLSALDAGEREQLAGLLRKLLLSYENTGPQAVELWGMRLEPGHIARQRRAAVGLSDPPGLLVSDISPHGPADEARLQRGDLITHAGGREIRTPDDLLDAATARAALTLDLLRAEHPHRITLTLPS
jgi:DNA-binding MarR family transcriptional regulator